MIEAVILVNSTNPDVGVGTISLDTDIETLLLNEVPITLTPVILDDGEGHRRITMCVIDAAVG